MLYNNKDGLFVQALVAVGISKQPLIVRMDSNFEQLIKDFPDYNGDTMLEEYGENVPGEPGIYDCKFKVEMEDKRYDSENGMEYNLVFYVEKYKDVTRQIVKGRAWNL